MFVMQWFHTDMSRQQRSVSLWIVYVFFSARPTFAGTGLVNLALSKPASQSSTAYDGHAHLAADGITSSNYNDGSCSHTDTASGNWWLVDLQNTALIYEISIYNRNSNGDRLRDFNILIGKSLEAMNLCKYFSGPGADGASYTISCTEPITGRYVKLQKVDDTDYLTLCEVQVWGIQGLQADYYTSKSSKHGNAEESVSIVVPSNIVCPFYCLQDPQCVGYNLYIGTTNITCELLHNNITVVDDNSGTLLYT